ncbi:DUF4410 domain-containing protein [Luteimonas marina]|nr:DUF4410 domain-containing protein [Luteimonas marina]
MIRKAVLLLSVSLVAAFPAAHAQQDDPAPARSYAYAFSNQGGDDADGIARLDSFIQQRLRDANLLATGDGRRATGAGDGKVEVTVTHYYARSDGARAWAGVMAGRDKVVSRVRVLDRGGKALDEFEVKSSNATAFGSTAGLHEKHADEIVARVKQVQ